MKTNLKRLLFLAIFLTVLIVPYLVFAANGALDNMQNVGNSAGFKPATETSVSEIAGTIVNSVLGFLGIIFLGLILYAGFLWMTAQGESDKVEQAKKIIKNCIIGLILIICAWGIYAVVARVFDATSGDSLPPPAGDSPAAGADPIV